MMFSLRGRGEEPENRGDGTSPMSGGGRGRDPAGFLALIHINNSRLLNEAEKKKLGRENDVLCTEWTPCTEWLCYTMGHSGVSSSTQKAQVKWKSFPSGIAEELQ